MIKSSGQTSQQTNTHKHTGYKEYYLQIVDDN